MKKVNVGIIGLGQRGTSLLGTLLSCERACIVAVCDNYGDRRRDAAKTIADKTGNMPAEYENYRDLLADTHVDAVIISSSWDSHMRIAIDSMHAGKVTGMEVGGAYEIEECFALVKAYEQTRTPFMMLENCCYDRFELLVTRLVRENMLGEPVHCRGAYCHDLRSEICGGNVNRHYRLENYKKRNCENYPTHALGPLAKILNINRGNRFISLVSVASKAVGLSEFVLRDENPDKTLIGTRFKQADVVNTIITCANGETISLTLDTTLPRYYSRDFTVQGTKGICLQDANMVLLEDKINIHEFWEAWQTTEKYLNNANEYSNLLPMCWREITDEEKALGHGGMDYIMMNEFLRCAAEGLEMPIDVYDAAAWAAVSALSERSIALGGTPQTFPDFTCGAWLKRPQKDVYCLGE